MTEKESVRERGDKLVEELSAFGDVLEDLNAEHAERIYVLFLDTHGGADTVKRCIDSETYRQQFVRHQNNLTLAYRKVIEIAGPENTHLYPEEQHSGQLTDVERLLVETTSTEWETNMSNMADDPAMSLRHFRRIESSAEDGLQLNSLLSSCRGELRILPIAHEMGVDMELQLHGLTTPERAEHLAGSPARMAEAHEHAQQHGDPEHFRNVAAADMKKNLDITHTYLTAQMHECVGINQTGVGSLGNCHSRSQPMEFFTETMHTQGEKPEFEEHVERSADLRNMRCIVIKIHDQPGDE